MRTDLELMQVLEDNKFIIIEGFVDLLLLFMLVLLFALHLQVTSVEGNVGLRYSDLHVCWILRIRATGFEWRTDKELRSLSVHSIRLRSVRKDGRFYLTDGLVHVQQKTAQ